VTVSAAGVHGCTTQSSGQVAHVSSGLSTPSPHGACVGVGEAVGESVGVEVKVGWPVGKVALGVAVAVTVDVGGAGSGVSVGVNRAPHRDVSIWQAALQTTLPAPKPRLPQVMFVGKNPSHCSTWISTTPSPQRAGWHVEVHASLSLVLPSSQRSPVSMTPLPQLAKFCAESLPQPPMAKRTMSSAKAKEEKRRGISGILLNEL
jgi:hypothetical protein